MGRKLEVMRWIGGGGGSGSDSVRRSEKVKACLNRSCTILKKPIILDRCLCISTTSQIMGMQFQEHF